MLVVTFKYKSWSL